MYFIQFSGSGDGLKGESGEPVFFVQKNDCEWLKNVVFGHSVGGGILAELYLLQKWYCVLCLLLQ